MSDDNNQQIIIKKTRKKGEAGHGGAWKVAYADFVTAMMALFIVLWILAQDPEIKDEISNYFNDPLGSVVQAIPGKVSGRDPNNSIAPDLMDLVMMRQKEKEKLEEMGKDIVQQLTNEDEFKALVNQIEITITEEGLLIEIMESQQDSFFDIGTATLKKNSEDLLIKIGKQLSQINNRIVLEGHTDSRQFPGNGLGYTNYELSTDRANAARRALLKGGVESSQINEIRGYADNRLKDQNDPFSAANRRISIIVRFKSVDA